MQQRRKKGKVMEYFGASGIHACMPLIRLASSIFLCRSRVRCIFIWYEYMQSCAAVLTALGMKWWPNFKEHTTLYAFHGNVWAFVCMVKHECRHNLAFHKLLSGVYCGCFCFNIVTLLTNRTVICLILVQLAS